MLACFENQILMFVFINYNMCYNCSHIDQTLRKSTDRRITVWIHFLLNQSDPLVDPLTASTIKEFCCREWGSFQSEIPIVLANEFAELKCSFRWKISLKFIGYIKKQKEIKNFLNADYVWSRLSLLNYCPRRLAPRTVHFNVTFSKKLLCPLIRQSVTKTLYLP